MQRQEPDRLGFDRHWMQKAFAKDKKAKTARSLDFGIGIDPGRTFDGQTQQTAALRRRSMVRGILTQQPQATSRSIQQLYKECTKQNSAQQLGTSSARQKASRSVLGFLPRPILATGTSDGANPNTWAMQSPGDSQQSTPAVAGGTFLDLCTFCRLHCPNCKQGVFI